MRILHISTRLILGGSQENTVLSCEGQARLGHDVHLAYGPIYGPEGSMLDRVERFNERVEADLEGPDTRKIHTHEVPDLVRAINPLRDRLALRQLRWLIAELRPDVVHTHSSKAGILGRVVGWAHSRSVLPDESVAVVHTIHGPPFMPIEGNPLARLRTRVSNWLYTVAERHAAKRCHAMIAVADAMTQQFLARGIGRAEQYVTVHSGMEVGPFTTSAPGQERAAVRDRLGLGEGDFVLGTVARLAQHKGHDDVLDALGEDLRANRHWKLLWVGDGWWRDRLMRRVKGMGLEHQVITTGLVEPERIPGLMRAMDVLIHPSYREGLPRTVPQALLAGTPVIATDVDGTREACIDGRTGLLVPLGDRAALRGAVRWMHGHPRERVQLALTGRELCWERFSAEHMVEALEEVYRRVLGQGRAGAS